MAKRGIFLGDEYECLINVRMLDLHLDKGNMLLPQKFQSDHTGNLHQWKVRVMSHDAPTAMHLGDVWIGQTWLREAIDFGQVRLLSRGFDDVELIERDRIHEGW